VLEQQIKQLEERIQDFGGINEKAFEAFKNIEVEFNETEKQVKKVEEERDNVLKMIEEIESKKKDTFMDTFDKINAHFQNIFSVLSPGGMAELVIENKENPLEEGAGIEIMAKPRGKRMFTTRSMSGGEKTLIAIAFIFSIQEFNPAPFYILDEIDAALDKENSLMLADLLFEYSKKAQFIIISHNDSVYAKCDNLFGVSMNSDGLSQVVGIKLPF